jgi:hypothetical protein
MKTRRALRKIVREIFGDVELPTPSEARRVARESGGPAL